MGLKAAENHMKKYIKPPTNMRMGEWLLMKLVIKGTGSPFKEDEKNPAEESKLNEDESKLSLTLGNNKNFLNKS